MSPGKFHSCLAGKIQNFIHLRCLSGTDYQSQARLLGYFDRFLLTQRLNEPLMTSEITDGYQQSLSHLAPRSRSNASAWSDSFASILPTTIPAAMYPNPLGQSPHPGLTRLIFTVPLSFKRSWRPPANCRRRTRFGLTPTKRFWGLSTARGSGLARPWP